MTGSDRALSFGSVAEVYDRARAGFPREAAAWLTGTTRQRVLELGAGTGKLTEQLVALGHDVMATDPSEEMLDVLRAKLPDTRTAVCSAESIPFASRSADVVVAAQCFHWFDLDKALPEIARVLRPGGMLALVWNIDDARIPWVRRLGEMTIGSGVPRRERDPSEELAASGLFEEVERAELRHRQHIGRRQMLDLALSRSYVATLPAEERTALLDRVGELYDEYGRGSAGLQLPYVTYCYRTTLRATVTPRPEETVAVQRADDGTPLFSLS